MELIATRRMTYATRHLSPGDRFIADDRVSRVLIATKKATKAPADAAAHEIVGQSGKPADDDIAALRAQYTAVIGKRPFPGWDAKTLIEKIAEAQGKA